MRPSLAGFWPHCGLVPLAALVLLAPHPLRALQQPAESGDQAYIREHYIKSEHRVPMRDGIHLFTVVYTPRDAAPGHRYPILIERTPFSVAPYGVDNYPTALGPDRFMLRDGYIYVLQDVRGRYLSEGEFENVRPLLADSVRARRPAATDEATDSYDTIEWLLTHVANTNGKIGIWGASYRGFYAAMALASHHPALVAASPQAPVTDMYFEDFHHNGALTQGYFATFPIFGMKRLTPTTENWWLPALLKLNELSSGSDYGWMLALGPVSGFATRYYPGDRWWQSIVAHPDYDTFWQERSVPRRLRGVSAAVLVVGGWFDGENLFGPFALYENLRRASPAARTSLVVGPFGHRGWLAADAGPTVVGNVVFGDSLATDYQRNIQAPFFRAYLKGVGTAEPAGVRVFDTGTKRWQSYGEWPPAKARTDALTLYLHHDGMVSQDAPSVGGGFREYISDPVRPVPTRCSGPTTEDFTLYMIDDQRCFASRGDVLTFTSAPLDRDLSLIGPVMARLMVSTTGTDADFVVKLIDVYPDDLPTDPRQPDSTVVMAGFQQLVRGEIMRGRYRRSFSAPVAFRPNERTEVDVRLLDLFHTFRKGHRIMIQVQSSWFPLFDRNPQRFVKNIYEAPADAFVAATQRVWTAPEAASRLEVRVVGRE